MAASFINEADHGGHGDVGLKNANLNDMSRWPLHQVLAYYSISVARFFVLIPVYRIRTNHVMLHFIEGID